MDGRWVQKGQADGLMRTDDDVPAQELKTASVAAVTDMAVDRVDVSVVPDTEVRVVGTGAMVADSDAGVAPPTREGGGTMGAPRRLGEGVGGGLMCTVLCTAWEVY